MNVKRVLIFGLGLIGGSLARALRVVGVEVYAVDVDASALALAELNDWINQGIVLTRHDSSLGAHSNLPGSEIDAIRKVAICCDMIVLAAPLTECPKILAMLSACIPERVVITDIGSVKKPFLEFARLQLGDAIGQYVSAHPIAGSEKEGVAASSQDLFKDKTVVLCSFDRCNESGYLFVSDMWRAIGARVETIDVSLHDRIFSAVSHFPHLLAFSSINLESAQEINSLDEISQEQMRRHTRIAAASALVWSGILLENRDNILFDLRSFRKIILDVQAKLNDPNGISLLTSAFCVASKSNSPWKIFFDELRSRDSASLPKMLFLPTIVVFCYLQNLMNHSDFAQLRQFTGTGFRDFVCLSENFHFFCNPNIFYINLDYLQAELASFLGRLAIFEDLLIKKNIVKVAEKIAKIAEFCRK